MRAEAAVRHQRELYCSVIIFPLGKEASVFPLLNESSKEALELLSFGKGSSRFFRVLSLRTFLTKEDYWTAA